MLSPDFYDPGVNPLVPRCSGTLRCDSAAVQSARSRSKKEEVESGVNHAQMTPLKGCKKFESLEEARGRILDHWEERRPGPTAPRIHGRTKRQVAAMFAEEKPFLQTLPVEPFRYYQYGERTVHIDGCVEVDAAYYGAPPGWIGRKVSTCSGTRCSCRLLSIPAPVSCLREHLGGKRGGHRIRDADRRPRRTPPPLLQLLARAHKAGSQYRRGLRRYPRSPGRTRDTVASRAFSNWSSTMAARLRTMLARRPWNFAFLSIASCAAIWSVVRRLLSLCDRSIHSSANSASIAT